MKQKLTGRAVGVVIACFLLCLVLTGISNTCGYPFVVPIATELGLASGVVSFMFTFASVATVVCSFLAAFFLKKIPFKVVICAGGVIAFIGWLLMSRTSSLGMLYFAHVLKGFGGCLCGNMIANVTLMNWFKKPATVVALCGAMNSLGPAIFSTPIAKVLAAGNWRGAALWIGVACLVVPVISGLFLIRRTPQECGLKPVGESLDGDNAESIAKYELPGVEAKVAMKKPAFYILYITAILQMLIVVALSTQRTPIIMSLGVDLVQSGQIVAILSAVAIAVQFLFGLATDKFGIRVTFTAISVLYLVALIMGAVAPQGYTPALVFGLLTTFYSCGFNIAAMGLRTLFGPKGLTTMIPAMSVGSNLGAVFGSIIINSLVTLNGGSFTMPLIVLTVATFITAILANIALVKKNRFTAA